MKKSVLFIAIVITTIGLTFFYMDMQKDVASINELQQDTRTSQIDANTNFYGIQFSELKAPFDNENFNYFIRGRYIRPTTLEKLKNAQFISDVVPNYPSSWISAYTSVEVSTTINGKYKKAISLDDVLTTEQKDILNSADLADDIVIDVKFKTNNAVTNKLENRELNTLLTVVPDIEAEYIGGYDQMIEYLIDNSSEEISAKNLGQLELSSITFTVDKEGKIEDVKLIETTGNAEIDKLFVDLIVEMPKWRPAKNEDGSQVKQEFEFIFGFGLDGC